MTSQQAAQAQLPATPDPEYATLPNNPALLVDNLGQADEENESSIEERRKRASLVLLTTPSPQLSSHHHPQPSRSTTPNSRGSAVLHLSSPPPTVVPTSGLSDDPVKDALPVLDENDVSLLKSELQDARTDAAHYRLQYQMLTIETAETVERIQVEIDMAQRERDVLQAATEQQQDVVDLEPARMQAAPAPVPVPMLVPDPNIRSVHVDLYSAMIQEISDLKSRNSEQETTLAHQKKIIVKQENEISSLNDRIVLLRERLQENREHLNRYRRPDSTPRSERSTPYRSTPQKHTVVDSSSREPRLFAALLHAATDVMSNESPSVPTTPKRKRDYVPSMPVTPQTAQPRLSRNIYETPQSSRSAYRRAPPMSAPAPRMASLISRSLAPTNPHRTIESDGTVSASDDSEADTEVPENDEGVQESQASLFARQLLRTPTRPVAHRGTGAAPPLMTQSRLFGHVKKAGVQRDDDERQAKKMRVEHTADLGIIGPSKE